MGSRGGAGSGLGPALPTSGVSVKHQRNPFEAHRNRSPQRSSQIVRSASTSVARSHFDELRVNDLLQIQNRAHTEDLLHGQRFPGSRKLCFIRFHSRWYLDHHMLNVMAIKDYSVG